MKKKLLFVIDSLQIGGAEKSLVTLLNHIDYNLYDVDLQLFSYGGAFEGFLPQNVHILPPLKYTKSIELGIKDSLSKGWIPEILSRWYFSFLIRVTRPNVVGMSRLYWRCISWCIGTNPRQYDMAIAYGQGVPTFYVATKIHANKKAAWINARYLLEGKDKRYQRLFYHKFDNIVCVSADVMDLMIKTYPDLRPRYKIINDIIDADFIQKMSEIPANFDPKGHKNILVTVARLEREDKGYDILLEAARILKNNNVDYIWLIVGEGSYRPEMERFIEENGLLNNVILLGSRSNPYPYFRLGTVYVQTSRSEGFGLSIAEARMLGIPVVTTAYKGYETQMINNKNGIVVPIDPCEVANAITDLLNNTTLRDSISEFQLDQRSKTVVDIQCFNALVP